MKSLAALVVAATVSSVALIAQTTAPARTARVSESLRTIPTYPFSEPNPIPILAKDTRLYPYFSFEGYAQTSTPKQWKVVTLENDWIEVKILPEVGGKVWGARVKKTGHDFIYTNDALKFRNVALRGPWTSGGIEFNFGVVGHTPSTATPVDYITRKNTDGSVSCVVGTMDLPSHTEWRVEIRLPADKAAFETNVLWHNPTTLEQPYYNWMTSAAFAKGDLTMSIPGDAYLDHPGPRHDWPMDAAGHYLPGYANNKFGSNKSFHVVGELNDTFGGYYASGDFGFGHWARHEDMPGQKLWLWALSRAGGIWEDLLTDKMGQYVEYQAGRLLVQYTPGADQTPIRQAGFNPMATDRWSETWFPLEGIGGLTEASRDAAIGVQENGTALRIGVNSFIAATDTLRVLQGARVVYEQTLKLTPLQPVIVNVTRAAGVPYLIELPKLRVSFDSDAAARKVSRPTESDASAITSIPETDRLVFEAKELVQARRYEQARPLLEKALASSPWHHDGLLAMADLEYRRARYSEGLALATKALRIDTYDADANMIAANLHRALGHMTDARDAYGWAARSLTYRAAANTALAELALSRTDWPEAERYARIALDFNRQNLTAWEALAVSGRHTRNTALATEASTALLALDPLHHFVAAERYLTTSSPATLDTLLKGLRSEFPDQTVLELVAGYVNRGQRADAVALLEATSSRFKNPLLRAWRASLTNNPTLLSEPADITLVFPHRLETLPVLTWAARANSHWSWTYLAALNLWGFDRIDEAATMLKSLGDTPSSSVFYVTRATLVQKTSGAPEADLKRATALAGANRPLHLPLIQYYQSVGRWADALSASTAARGQFRDDFNLDILHAKSLINLGRGADALTILNATHVLPSEGARESHQLYVQAHVIETLAAIAANRLDDAQAHIAQGLEWPEHLGQGRPYQAEERLLLFLRAITARQLGRASDEREAFTAIAAATTPNGALTTLDLLAIPALKSLGRSNDMTSLLASAAQPSTNPSVAALARALADTTSRTTLPALDARLSGDLDATLILRALQLAQR